MASHRIKAHDARYSWTFDESPPKEESTDGEFADKLGDWLLRDDYEEEAKRRGVSIERLFELILQEAMVYE